MSAQAADHADAKLLPGHLPVPGQVELDHIPGPRVRSSVISTLRFLADPLGAALRNYELYGSIFRNRSFGTWRVALFGPDANELVLRDKDDQFSSQTGWGEYISRLFPRGLMLMDGTEHRVHRKTVGMAFKAEPMRRYLDQLSRGVARGMDGWFRQSGTDNATRGPVGAREEVVTLKIYPAIKKLTLDLAATSFLGLEWGPDADRINRAFVDMVQASVGIIRRPVPGSAMWRGIRGRRTMCAFFAAQIPHRRGRDGDDFFTQLCNVRSEDGALLTDQEVIDHMSFLMMAAHDTLTSSLTSTVYYLARHPNWQDWVREEVLNYGSGPLTYDRLGEFKRLEMCFREALRLRPPVTAVPRRAVKSFTFRGYHVPRGSYVGINLIATHHMPDLWPDPALFDPMRFSEENSAGRHRYAWAPFGGGAHMCLGLNFSYMQAKVFFHQLLSRFEISLEERYDTRWQIWPMPRPRDGLPVRFRALGEHSPS